MNKVMKLEPVIVSEATYQRTKSVCMARKGEVPSRYMDTSVPRPNSNNNDVIKFWILEREDIVVHSCRGPIKVFCLGQRLTINSEVTLNVDNIDEIQRCLAPSIFDGPEALQ